MLELLHLAFVWKFVLVRRGLEQAFLHDKALIAEDEHARIPDDTAAVDALNRKVKSHEVCIRQMGLLVALLHSSPVLEFVLRNTAGAGAGPCSRATAAALAAAATETVHWCQRSDRHL